MSEETTPKKRGPGRWSHQTTRYTERLIEDEQRGDAVTETEWLTRRKEQTGWRNGAKVR